MASTTAVPPQTFPYDYLFKVLIIGDASVGKVRCLQLLVSAAGFGPAFISFVLVTRMTILTRYSTTTVLHVVKVHG